MSSDDNGVRIHDYSRTSDHVTESTKNVATDIRESSSKEYVYFDISKPVRRIRT
jgi:hypothetical protein